MRLRHMMMAPAGDAGTGGAAGAGSADAGGGSAGGAAGGSAGAGQPGGAAGAGQGAGGADKPTDTTNDLAALRKLVDDLTADKAKRDKADADAAAKAEDERKKSLTEADKLRETIADLTKRQADGEAKSLADARTFAADRLSIPAKLLPLVPADADPRTDAGKAVFEKWVQDNSDILPKAAPPTKLDVPSGGALEDILNGKVTHPLLSKETVLKTLKRLAG